MRIGDNLSPFWHNVVLFLWVIGFGVNFFVAVSALWGWHPSLGAMGCLVLVALVHEDRRAVRMALKGQLKAGDRVFALYILALAALAISVNVVVAAKWMMRS